MQMHISVRFYKITKVPIKMHLTKICSIPMIEDLNFSYFPGFHSQGEITVISLPHTWIGKFMDYRFDHIDLIIQ